MDGGKLTAAADMAGPSLSTTCFSFLPSHLRFKEQIRTEVQGGLTQTSHARLTVSHPN